MWWCRPSGNMTSTEQQACVWTMKKVPVWANAELYLRQANAWLEGYRNALVVAEAEEIAKTQGDYDQKSFRQTFYEQYKEAQPLTLTFGDETLTLDDLAQRDIYVIGPGYTAHDTMRTLMQMLSGGDVESLDAKITWAARGVDVQDREPWPGNLDNMKDEPAEKMVTYAASKSKSIRHDNLTYISGIERDAESGDITNITFQERIIDNPDQSAVDPQQTEYLNGGFTYSGICRSGQKTIGHCCHRV